ncbi:putative ribonuclease H-like domain-containing protein [Tanacetum coccineum]
MDALYNNLKVYKPEVKGMSSSSSSTQNMDFVSSSNNNSGSSNEVVNTAKTANTAYEVSIASTQVNTVNSSNVDNLSDAVIYAFLASQPNSPQLVTKDLKQIHLDDIEEIDLRWQMVMLTMRARRFLKNTGRRLIINSSENIGFDKSKVECYNCHKKIHFAKEYRALRNQDYKNKESTRRNIPVETSTSTALVSCDGLGGLIDCQIVDNCKKGLGYNAVLPPYIGNFMPPTPDLSFTSLDEFVNKHVVENRNSNEEVSKVVRKSNDSLIIEDWVPDSEEEDVSQTKTKKKTVKPSIAKIEFVKYKQQKKTARKTVKQIKKHRQNTHNPRGNQRNWSSMMSQNLGSNLEMFNKALKPVWNNAQRANHQNFARKTHPCAKKNIVPRAVLMKSGLVSINTARQNISNIAVSVHTARQVNTAHPKIAVNAGRPMSYLSKTAHSTVKRPTHKNTAFKNSNFNQRVNIVQGNNVNIVRPKEVVNAARPKAVFNDVQGNNVNAGNPKMYLQDQGVIDGGCLRYMIGNMSYLTDYEEIDGGYVTFGENPKGGKITGKATKDETSGILKSFITGIENLVDHKVKVIRCDNGTEFKNREMNQFCKMKGILRTTIGKQFILLAMCKMSGRVKPLTKTPYELFHGKTPTLSFMRPFGCPVTILNTIDYLSKFDGKADESFFVRYSLNSNAFRVFNSRTRIVEENLHIRFSENTLNVVGSGPDWIFDIDSLIRTMNYKPIVADPKSSQDDGSKPSSDDEKKVDKDPRKDSEINAVGRKTSIELLDDPNMPALEDISIFNLSRDNEDVSAEADMNNLDTTIQVSPIPTTRIHKDHPLNQLQEVWTLLDLPNGKRAIGTKWVFRNKKDERGIMKRNQTRLVAQGYTQEEGIDYDEVFAPVARIKVIRLFLAYASFKDFVVYQMDVKSTFLYGKIEEEVYVCQPPGFEDPDFLDRVYKVEKALYGLHQAPRAWYETLSTYLLDNEFQRGKIDKTLFIKRYKGDIVSVQVYVDYIIFGSTKKELCNAFEKLIHEKFQMSSMGELIFFLGLQVQQKKDDIFISQDKYVGDILKKFRFIEVKTASTPIETQKPLLKDKDGEEVDVHMYRSMIGSLMYCTSSRPDIMFAVCAYVRYQVNLKVSHLYAVKKIFRDCNEKKLIQIVKIHTDKNVTDLLTKAFDAKTVNGEVQLQALVDGKKIIITESILRTYLQLEDAEGVDCLPNATIFEQLTLMGSKITAWNEFSSTMAFVIICLATNQKFNFSKYIFESMVKNLDNMGKFLMYPRFVQVFVNQQLDGLPSHKRIYVTLSHTKKIFRNMKRVGKGFSGRVTPLFPTMVVHNQEEMGEGSAMPTDPHHTPTIIQPSTSQPQMTQKPRRSKRKDTEVPQPSSPTTNVADEVVNEEMDDSLVRVATTASSLEAEQDSGNINKTQSKATPNEPSSLGTSSGGGPRHQETMGDTIAQTRSKNVSKLSNDPLLARVLNLETTKTTQANETKCLKRRVKKLEKKNKSKTHKLKRLYKVGLSARVESSRDEESLGEDASKQGKRITDIDDDEYITLVNDQIDVDADMFDVDTLTGDEVLAEQVVAAKDVNLSVEVTLAQALAAFKSAKVQEKEDVIKEPSVPVSIVTASTTDSATTTTATIPTPRKGIVFQEPEPEKPIKKKELIRLNEEIASKLQAEFNEERRLAKIEADHELAQRLQAEEQEELSDAEKATLFVQLLEKRRKHFAPKREKEKRNKPPTQAQQRKIMCTYLKNMEGKKPKDLKDKSFDFIQKMFDRAFKRVNTFVDFRTDLVEGSSKRARE